MSQASLFRIERVLSVNQGRIDNLLDGVGCLVAGDEPKCYGPGYLDKERLI